MRGFVDERVGRHGSGLRAVLSRRTRFCTVRRTKTPDAVACQLPESGAGLGDGGHKDADVALLATLAACDVDSQTVLVLQQVKLADQASLQQVHTACNRLTLLFWRWLTCLFGLYRSERMD